MTKKDQSKIIQKLSVGTLCRDYSGRLTYEIYDFPSERYTIQKKKIAKEFRLIPFGITINGLDETFQTYIRGLNRVGIEWDIWSGFIVVAKNKGAETLVKEICCYLEETVEI